MDEMSGAVIDRNKAAAVRRHNLGRIITVYIGQNDIGKGPPDVEDAGFANLMPRFSAPLERAGAAVEHKNRIIGTNHVGMAIAVQIGDRWGAIPAGIGI